MTAKQYLRQIRQLSERIEAKLIEIERLRSLAESMRGHKYGERLKTEPKNVMEESIVKLTEVQEQVQEEVAELIKTRDVIRTQIDMLPNEEERFVLYYRYVVCLKWEKISEIMHYSRRSVLYLHGRALQSFSSLHSFAH